MTSRKKWMKAALCLTCVFTCLFTSALAANESQQAKIAASHISDVIFDGYSGMETNNLGQLGYNYALTTPDGSKELLFGFNPQRALTEDAVPSILGAGIGWDIKLPHIEINDGQMWLCGSRGQQYFIEANSLEIVNYPSEYDFFTDTQDGECIYVLNEGYGKQTIFSEEGLPLRTVDEFGEATEYTYDGNLIAEIAYADGAVISFDRGHDTMTLEYNCDGETSTLAVMESETNPAGTMLMDISTDIGDCVSFEYFQPKNSLNMLLESYSINDYQTKSFIYESCEAANGAVYYRVDEIISIYADGDETVRDYTYNMEGRIKKLVTGSEAQITYSYSENRDGSLSITTNQEYHGETSASTRTLNELGQTICYEQDDSILEITYNDKNKVSRICEDGRETSFTYNDFGLVDTAESSDGSITEYYYRTDGSLRKKTADGEEVFFDRNGAALPSINEEFASQHMDINSLIGLNGTRASGLDEVTIDYKINSSVGVTNYLDVYGLTIPDYNCYTFAISKPRNSVSPGYYCGNDYAIIDSMPMLKLAVEEDMDALGYDTYDTTVSESISGHEWKIAFRIRKGYDYHFMHKGVLSPWRFKAGRDGPVMELLNSKTPKSVSWDQYEENKYGEFEVVFSNCYNSEIDYLIIED